MARVIRKSSNSSTISNDFNLQKTIALGVGMGVVFWILSQVLTPRFGISSGGSVATVLTATIGMLGLSFLSLSNRPLLISVAVASSLWWLAGATQGLACQEILFWDVLIFTIAYLVFGWLTRYKNIVIAIIITVILLALINAFIA